ncbi:hypothetical protein [Stenotrophomonas sp. NRRL B-14846]|uniref:hypothetical protein n=1 Tax=Stenotrophomonas sp. NRRL B-14846 TaxID=3162882 RepID=UPI003D29B47D
MRQHRILVIAVIEDDTVASELGGIHLARTVVGDALDHLHHRTVGRREDRPAKAEIVLVALTLATMGTAIADHQQVHREALAGVGGVVVLFDTAPAPRTRSIHR